MKTYEQFSGPNYQDYVIGFPSGEIIDLMHVQVTQLMKLGLIHWNSKYCRYTYKDEQRETILKYSNEKEKSVRVGNKPDTWLVHNFFEKLGIKKDQWRFNEQNEIDILTSLNISGLKLEMIPFRFGTAFFDFDCSRNMLTTLKNSPKIVHGNFNCSDNSLSSLKGGPSYVIGSYDCSENLLPSLEGSPKKIGKSFICSYNNIKMLTGGPDEVGEVMDCGHNLLRNFKGKPICKEFIYNGNPI